MHLTHCIVYIIPSQRSARKRISYTAPTVHTEPLQLHKSYEKLIIKALARRNQRQKGDSNYPTLGNGFEPVVQAQALAHTSFTWVDFKSLRKLARSLLRSCIATSETPVFLLILFHLTLLDMAVGYLQATYTFVSTYLCNIP
jgi:hypothetical protein